LGHAGEAVSGLGAGVTALGASDAGELGSAHVAAHPGHPGVRASLLAQAIEAPGAGAVTMFRAGQPVGASGAIGAAAVHVHLELIEDLIAAAPHGTLTVGAIAGQTAPVVEAAEPDGAGEHVAVLVVTVEGAGEAVAVLVQVERVVEGALREATDQTQGHGEGESARE